VTRTAWILVVLTVAAVIVLTFAREEIIEVLRLFRHADVMWLLAAFGLQILTYVAAAGVWYVALRPTSHRQPLLRLIRVALVMLFSNQAVPSAGISGGLVAAKALTRHRVPESVAVSALLLGLVTAYIALSASFVVAAVWASAFPRLFPVILTAGVLFLLMAGGVTALVFASQRLSKPWRRRLTGMPLVGKAVASVINASTDPMRGGALVEATSLQVIEIFFDAATLGASLLAVGSHPAAIAVFGSYVIAEVGSRVAVVPLGIGTFEAACVTLLHAGGVPVETALAGTLLFRGFTIWLPMVAGLLSAKKALGEH
jgi:uncharacterized protein (TIRG00374 family)